MKKRLVGAFRDINWQDPHKEEFTKNKWTAGYLLEHVSDVQGSLRSKTNRIGHRHGEIIHNVWKEALLMKHYEQ